jgi:hypothetical protein
LFDRVNGHKKVPLHKFSGIKMIIILVYTFKVYSTANTACLIVYNNA